GARAERRRDHARRGRAHARHRDQDRRRADGDLPRRRADRGDADRLHGLLALGRGADPAARHRRLRDHADLPAHADAEAGGAAPHLARRDAGDAARGRGAAQRGRPRELRAPARRSRPRAWLRAPRALRGLAAALALRRAAREAPLGHGLIERLRIESLAVVESVELELAPGLNVLTGETGAGKSLILGAVALLAGGRASADAVRPGAAEARVEAVLRIEAWPELEGELRARGLASDDHE